MEKAAQSFCCQITGDTVKDESGITIFMYSLKLSFVENGRTKTKVFPSLTSDCQKLAELQEKLLKQDVSRIHIDEIIYDFLCDL